jgi:hypothetical protein
MANPTFDKKKFRNEFSNQSKEFQFSNDELIKYRSEAEKHYESKDFNEKIDEVLKKGYVAKTITKERIENRNGRLYGYSGLHYEIEYNKETDKFEYVAHTPNGKVYAKEEFKKSIPKEKQTDELKKEIAKKGFDYANFYIPENHDKITEEAGQYQEKYISYNTFYRIGIIIYRMQNNKKYEVIFQMPSSSKYPSSYIPYQSVIAGMKEKVLQDTGLTLEEWIYLARTKDDIFIEGGVHYKREKGIYNEKTGRFHTEIDFERYINFEEI